MNEPESESAQRGPVGLSPAPESEPEPGGFGLGLGRGLVHGVIALPG